MVQTDQKIECKVDFLYPKNPILLINTIVLQTAKKNERLIDLSPLKVSYKKKV